MDPHSTPTSAYETEVEADRPRGGIPAFLNAVLVTGGLWVLQFLSGSAPFSTWIEENGTDSAGWAAALLGDRLTYFGEGSFGSVVSGGDLVHSAVLTATVFVLTWLLTWLGTIGIWPRAFWPVFLGCWFAATLATAGGQVAGSAYSYVSGDADSVVASLGAVLESGAAYGLTYGWAIGFLIALIWLAIPGKRAEVEEYTPMSSLISGGGPSGGPSGGSTGGPGAAPGGYGQQLRASVAVPTAQTSLARVNTTQPTQPVHVRTFTGPARGQGPAGDTAAWKDFVRDVRGRS